ncbi:Tetratricopeptide repeat-containing protein [Mucilaginibacter lappiensis]|uniref:Tetratricopeptide (TPR) repeat protein n=1 Tax=Mucilaginibacter lappiensis TaxID=354630 RepID=A0ABR6PFF8_9SPHI|nr:tetratricopeptide repeat protein [Mucilaginibacter lappiensis]MBB6107760.1 tetratricopeptide (TPR) repeat protein [Mucilaginibacter lappiensis]SIP97987.1 Tetratricopeptide repeat-containing protein [Mucilaginibacter lappiensis]
MKLLPLLTVLVLLGNSTYSQNSILRGRVTIQNSGFIPLTNAQVRSEGATAQTTDSRGSFKLIYSNKIPGSSIHIDIQKTGYQVVNNKDLSTKISIDELDTLKIWVCKTDELAKRKIQFYNINVKQITEKYNSIIKNLTYQKKITADTLQKLEKSKVLLIANVKELVDEFTVKNLDESSELNKQAYLLVQNGRADEAIKILEDKSLYESLDIARKELAESKKLDSISHAKLQNAKEAIEQIAESFSLKAKLFEQNFDFVNAEKNYKKAMLADTSDSFNTVQYAKFLNAQNRMFDVIPILRKALIITLAEQSKAFIYDLLGDTYLTLNNIDSAKSNYFKALDIYNDWYPTDPWIYDGHLAIELNNIGLLYTRSGQFQPAKYYLQKSLEFYDRLVQISPLEYTPNLSLTTATLGESYMNIGDLDSAKFFLKKSLQIFTAMDTSLMSGNQQTLSAIYDDLGIIYSHMSILDTALTYHLKALPIRRKLAGENFDRHVHDLANTLNNLGNVYNAEGKYNEAVAKFTECLDLLKKVSTNNPDEKFRIALTNINLGNSYKHLEKPETAEKHYKMSLDFFANVQSNNYYTEQYAKACFIIAGFYKYQKNNREAADLYVKALGIYKVMGKNHQQLDFYYYMRVVYNLCDIYQMEYIRNKDIKYKRLGFDLINDYNKLITIQGINLPSEFSTRIDEFKKIFSDK